MKKKILILAFSMLLVFTACGSNKPTASDNDAVPVSTKAPNAISQIATTNIVEEFEEKTYSFEPSTLVCNIPTAFSPSKEYEGEYVTKKFPKDISSINHVIMESDENPTNKTQEEFVSDLKKEFLDAYGENVEFDVTQYDKIEIDGRPGLWIMYNYDFRGDHYYILEVILYNGTESNYLTYLQGPKGDWMEEFAKSAETLHYVPIEN